ncbi:glycosyltransferase family 1 protein [Ktedonosporobacter rubrisoli]|uniref:Glycosyltransferase family 1 protein n=1 Tax=Ktedonosporobacter rubrisoli TaxID=2509675 RepID=A0A4P6JU45_KTERU|nr:glycosyltransferase family 1 protein [Ktedonosporobacter rubrisoli]QBD78446.1 glycosyltransferase family 1 protein [Ktedonosporobacter rubrisoli]
MHIGINAQLLSFGQNYRNGGVSRYIRYLLTELARQPGDHTYTVFVNGQEVIEHLAAEHPQITYFAAAWPEEQPAARVAWEQFTLPSLIRQKRIDVLHSPVNVLPEWLPRQCATVVTLHDLAFLRFPGVLTKAKRFYHRTFTIRSLRHATMVIAVSESTRQDAHKLVGIPLERVQTVNPCIDTRFLSAVEEEQIQAFRKQHQLENGYILYLGTLEPRKNITTLIEAYAQLRQNYTTPVKLVLAGGKGWLYDEIFAKVRELGLESEVIFPGFVTDTEQVLWYRAASVFAYPSLYEGFGIPVAEALACGIPVVTSNISSLPEAGAQIALCVDPYNIEGIARAMHRAITDQEFREKCRSSASSVAERFSAQRMVAQTREVYAKAAAVHALRTKHRHTSFVQ